MKRNQSRDRERSGFLSGVLVLSLSTLSVKIIGLAYKIPMIAYLGADGMGYFNSAMEIYAMLCVISTAGLPVALSMLISEKSERSAFGELRRTFRTALGVFLLLGAVGSLLMICFAAPLARAIGNENAYPCILAIAPSLLFVCASSAVRGYFQGLHRMVPTAISQLIEALGKLIFGVGFAAMALRKGLELPLVAACAILGVSLGCALSALYLLILKITERSLKGTSPSRKASVLPALLRIAIPITLSAAVLSVTRLLDMALIMRRLQSVGISASEANSVFGAYTTLAVPVFGLVPSLITPIAMALIPSLAAAIEGARPHVQAEVSDRAIRLTVLLSMPAAMGISLYAGPILSLLFREETEAVAIAAPLLSLLGGSVLLSGLITTTNGILQAYRKPWKPIASMAMGAAVKTVFAYILIGNPAVGAYGAPISTLLCNLAITAINLRYVASCVPKGQGSGFAATYLKPLLASLLAIGASVAVYLPVLRLTEKSAPAFFCAVATAAIVYGVLVLLLRIVTEEDLASLPLVGTKLKLGRKKKGNHAHDGGRKNQDVIGEGSLRL